MPDDMKEIILSKIQGRPSTVTPTDKTTNTFADIGEQSRTVTLSNGLFEEQHPKQKIVKYGQTIFETEKSKIVKFLDKDNSSYQVDPVVFALSVDPLTKDYPWYTPYQFAGNTPIQAIDLDGLEPVSVNGYQAMLWKEAGYTYRPNEKESRDLGKELLIIYGEAYLTVLSLAAPVEELAVVGFGAVSGKLAGLSARFFGTAKKIETAVSVSKIVTESTDVAKLGLRNKTLIVDENLSPTLKSALEKEGFNAKIFEKGTSDEDIIKFAQENDAVVITNNIKDFKNKNITTLEVPESLKPKAKVSELTEKIKNISNKSENDPSILNKGTNVKVNQN
jgi:predicted nuclease of predicted toxin-antitoxin system